MPLPEPVLLCVVGIFEKEEMHAQTYMNKVRIQINTLPFENEGKKVSSDVMLDRERGRGREGERDGSMQTSRRRSALNHSVRFHGNFV